MKLDLDLDTADDAPHLPPLRGTDNQIPWAEHVRKEKLAACLKLIRDWREIIARHNAAGRSEATMREKLRFDPACVKLDSLERQDTCRFWLDHRDNSAMELLTNAAANPGSTFTPRKAPE